jgi:hypothetical protein
VHYIAQGPLIVSAFRNTPTGGEGEKGKKGQKPSGEKAQKGKKP